MFEEMMFGNFLAMGPWMMALFAVLMVWTAIWKGIALWKSGRNGQLAWFVVLFIVNTVGILEIIYIFAFQKKQVLAKKVKKK
jgi:hypothetical protein